MVESAQSGIGDKMSDLLKAVERSIRASEENKETLTEAHELSTCMHADFVK
jgi:ABC-type transport system involved in Fe-S cluster assembly fused permease/ATPase subunit